VSNKKEASRFSWAFANTAHLPSYESLRTTAVADNSQHFYDPVRGYALRRFGDHFEGVCKKRVASQKSHVLPENLVVCRFSPSWVWVAVHNSSCAFRKNCKHWMTGITGLQDILTSNRHCPYTEDHRE